MEIHGFPKGIRDLYRVIAPIEASKFTVSPSKSPPKMFSQKYFWMGHILGAFSREGVSLAATKHITNDILFCYLKLLNMLKMAHILG